MTFSPNATNEQDYASELYPSVAAVASTYGDPDGKYAAFLQKVEPHYAAEAFFLWDQPLVGGYNGSYSNSQGTSKHGSDNGAIRVGVETYWMAIVGALLVPVLNFLFAC